MKSHEYIEKRLGVLAALVVVVISFGGLAEIVPLFHMSKTTTPIEGMKPWSAIQLEGRDIYIREGCHVCHTQMVRPFRAETERYGHYSVAGICSFPPSTATPSHSFSPLWALSTF